MIHQKLRHSYQLSQIGNVDETPVFFYLPSNRTVGYVGSKTVTIRTTGHDKTHFTAVLTCMADRTKLLPMVIFKRKTMPKEKFPAGVIIYVHPKGWMDTDGMLIWLQKVWGRCPDGGIINTKSLVVLDQFRAHLTYKAKQCTARSYNTDIAVMPGRLTSILQPLNVSINHLFKCKLCELWSAWMSSGSFERTAAGNPKQPSLSVINLSTAQSILNLSKSAL